MNFFIYLTLFDDLSYSSIFRFTKLNASTRKIQTIPKTLLATSKQFLEGSTWWLPTVILWNQLATSRETFWRHRKRLEVHSQQSFSIIPSKSVRCLVKMQHRSWSLFCQWYQVLLQILYILVLTKARKWELKTYRSTFHCSHCFSWAIFLKETTKWWTIFTLLNFSYLFNRLYTASTFFQNTSFYDKNGEIIHWVKLFGAIQQKRFKKKHMGPTPKATTSSPEDTTNPSE